MGAMHTRVAMHILTYDTHVSMQIVVYSTLISIQIYPTGKVMMYQRSCPSIVFWLLQSILSFFVSTHWVSILRWRSVILHDNRFPLMFEFRWKRWPKCITISNIGELSYQGSRDILEINTYQTHIKNHI